MNQVKNASKYKVGMSEQCGRIAIMEKSTNNVVESFAENIPEGLLVQRMMELREDELLRDKLIAGTSLEGTNGEQGIITTDLSMPASTNVDNGGII